MAVVRFRKPRPHRSIRYYLCTDEGPVRVPQRLCRDLDTVAVPQFASSTQRMIEALIEKRDRKIKSVSLRPTSTRFDEGGKADLHDAAEIMAEILGGSKPKRISENVLDIGPTLRTRAREREASWRIPRSVKRLILSDINGEGKLPYFRMSN